MPKLWSPDSPVLHNVTVTLACNSNNSSIRSGGSSGIRSGGGSSSSSSSSSSSNGGGGRGRGSAGVSASAQQQQQQQQQSVAVAVDVLNTYVGVRTVHLEMRRSPPLDGCSYQPTSVLPCVMSTGSWL